jgi:hypothetical protein
VAVCGGTARILAFDAAKCSDPVSLLILDIESRIKMCAIGLGNSRYNTAAQHRAAPCSTVQEVHHMDPYTDAGHALCRLSEPPPDADSSHKTSFQVFTSLPSNTCIRTGAAIIAPAK